MTRRNTFLASAAIALELALTGSSVGQNKAGITEEELIQRTRELYAGVDKGDSSAWRKYFADDCLYFDEKGRTMTKAALVEDITGFPPGYSGHLQVTKATSHIEGDVAILSFDLDEQETIFGQDMTARYHETDTWMLRQGQWRIVAGQVLRYYEDPAAGEADPGRYPEYAGTYELAPGNRLTISTDGWRLYRQRGEKAKEELIVESGDVYFRKGVEGRLLFRRDGGKVDALIDRRNNEDVVWKKVG